jgi:hypothetical protein
MQLLKELAVVTSSSEQERAAPAPAKPIVYLAECSPDQQEARDMLESELKLHGYTILPDYQLPRDEAARYRAAVEELLARCALSIHLVGKRYGVVPDATLPNSVVILQNELAVQRSKSSAMPRIIWLREGTSSTQPQQQAFITALHENAEVQFGAVAPR